MLCGYSLVVITDNGENLYLSLTVGSLLLRYIDVAVSEKKTP